MSVVNAIGAEQLALYRRNFRRTQDLLNKARNWRFLTRSTNRDDARINVVTRELEEAVDELEGFSWDGPAMEASEKRVAQLERVLHASQMLIDKLDGPGNPQFGGERDTLRDALKAVEPKKPSAI